MKSDRFSDWLRARQRGAAILRHGPQLAAFIPVMMLVGFWLGGEKAMVAIALVVPAIFALGGIFSRTGPAWSTAHDSETKLGLRDRAEQHLDRALAEVMTGGPIAAAIAIDLDDPDMIEAEFGPLALGEVVRECANRFAQVARGGDVVARLGTYRYVIAAGPMQRASLETVIAMAGRFQDALAEPVETLAGRVFVSVSVGFCLPGRARGRSGQAMIEGAEIAVAEARASGPGTIRAYAPALEERARERSTLERDVAMALEKRQITAWFQPHVSTESGLVTGFQAIPRWIHPERGLIPAPDFLPLIEARGLSLRLHEALLASALTGMRRIAEGKRQDDAVVSISPGAAVLSQPHLADHIAWELDRLDAAADRVSIELPQSVIDRLDDELLLRNITALGKLGLRVEIALSPSANLPLALYRRLSVWRLRIGRNLVTRIDRDAGRQELVKGILRLAGELSLQTIAEGVETAGELAMLTQLGCDTVQGYAVAGPMPAAKVGDWHATHIDQVAGTA